MGYSRREFIKVTGMGIAAGFFPVSIKAGIFDKTAKSNRPNIIFIITDDQKRQDFNFLSEGKDASGKNRNLTPTIDRLANEGVIFLNQHVSSSVCTPSRFSCLTGQYASRAQNDRFLFQFKKGTAVSIEWNTHIIPEVRSLPKILQKADYKTGMVGKNHVIEVDKLNKIPQNANPNDPKIIKLLKENKEIIEISIRQCGFDYAASIYNANLPGITCKQLQHHNMDWIVQGALDFIGQNNKEPFFLYMATTLNHGPDKQGTKYKADPRITPYGYLDKAHRVMPCRATIPKRLKKAGISDERAADNLWLDDGINAIMKKLEALGIDDNTIVFYFNDHGVEAGKGTLYEGGVLTPSFVWAKNHVKGQRKSNALVSNIDFAPTILDLCDVKYQLDWFDGRSFKSVLEGDDRNIHESLYFEIGYSRAVLKDNWKYLAVRLPEEIHQMSEEDLQKKLNQYNKGRKNIHTTDSNTRLSHMGMPGGRGSEQPAIKYYKHYYDVDQLYNLNDDPDEQNNLANDPKCARKLNEMKDLLAKHLCDIPGSFDEFKVK